MSELKPRDKISKALYFFVDEIKNSVALNLTVAAQNNKIDVKGEAHQKLMAVVMASIDEGFHKAGYVFGRQVDEALTNFSQQNSVLGVIIEPAKKNSP